MKKLKGCLQSTSKSNTKLPELGSDIIMSEILPRLPAKCVGRVKKVCKEWLSCISSEEFVMMHCKHMCKGSRQKILSIGKQSCSIVSMGADLVDDKTMITLPFHVRPSDVWILSSLNGLLCVCLRNTFEMLIWNPLIRSYINISNSKSDGCFKIYSDAVGLYVDSSKDFKVLHIKRCRTAVEVMVYSRSTGDWRRTQFLQKGDYHTKVMCGRWVFFCADGLYFTVFQFWLGGDIVIIRFDVNTERFTEIGFPYVGVGETCQGNLVNMNDKLHLFVSHGVVDLTVDLYFYEADCWTKVMSLPNIYYIPTPVWCSITHVSTEEKCFVMTDWGEVYIIDLNTKTCDLFISSDWNHAIRTATYVETIVPPSV